MHCFCHPMLTVDATIVISISASPWLYLLVSRYWWH